VIDGISAEILHIVKPSNFALAIVYKVVLTSSVQRVAQRVERSSCLSPLRLVRFPVGPVLTRGRDPKNC
jgi:hypothetical protein